jgi:hypothetical protein
VATLMTSMTQWLLSRCCCCCCWLQGSQAYAKALSKAGILTEEEAATIVDGLDKVGVLRIDGSQVVCVGSCTHLQIRQMGTVQAITQGLLCCDALHCAVSGASDMHRSHVME